MTSRRQVPIWAQFLCFAIVAPGAAIGTRAHAQAQGAAAASAAASSPASSASTPAATTGEVPAPPDAGEAPPAEPPAPSPVPPAPAPPVPRIDPEVPNVARPPAPKKGPTGLAFEMQTAGFLSGTLQGGIMLGYAADFIVVGLGMNYSRFKMKQGPNPQMIPESEQVASGVDLGPAVRFRLASTDDKKLELIGALDFRVQRATVSAGATEFGGMPETKLSGYLLSLGPGIRYWVHRHLALGYLTRLTYSALDGQQSLHSLIDSSTMGLADGNGSTDLEFDSLVFVGTFQVLAVF